MTACGDSSDMTGLTRSVSLDNLYKESGWVSLIERRKQQKLIFMYKSVNGLVPSYVSDLIPSLVGETNAYNLRNNNNITVPFCRTEFSRKSCIPSSISAWNSLDIELRNSPPLSSFKYQLKKKTQNNSIQHTTKLVVDTSQSYMQELETTVVIYFLIYILIICHQVLHAAVLKKLKMQSIISLDAHILSMNELHCFDQRGISTH